MVTCAATSYSMGYANAVFSCRRLSREHHKSDTLYKPITSVEFRELNEVTGAAAGFETRLAEITGIPSFRMQRPVEVISRTSAVSGIRCA